MSDPSSPFSSSRSKDKQPSPTRTNTRRRQQQQQQPHATPPTGTPSSSRRRSPPSSGSSAYEPIDFRLPDPLHPDEHPHQHLAPLQEETATPPDGSEHAEPTTATFPIVPTMLPPSTSPWSAGTEVSSRYDHGQREREREREYDDSSRSSHRRAYPQHHYQYGRREAYQGAPPSPPFLPSTSSRYQHHYRQGTRYQDYSYDYPRHPGARGQQQYAATSGHHDAAYHPPYRRSSSSLEYSSGNVSLPEEVPEAPEATQAAGVAQQVSMSGETSASAEAAEARASSSSRRPAHPGARSRHEHGSSDQRRYQEPRPPRMLPPSYTLEPQHRDHQHSRSDRRPPQDQDTAAVDQPARREAHHYQASDPRRDASSFESHQSTHSSAAHSHESAHSRTSSDAAHSSSSATPTHGPYRGGYRTQHPVAHPVSSSSSAAAAHHHPSYAPEGPPSSSRGQPRPSYAQQEALERHYGAPAAAAAGPGGSGEGTSPPPYPPAIASSSSYSTYPSGPPPHPSRHYPPQHHGYGGPPGHGPPPPPPPPPPHPHPSAYPPYHPGMYPPPPYYGAGGPAPLPFVYDINTNDVLCGRGGATNSHVGNRSFRSLVKSHQDRYLRAKKKEKPAVAAHIVELVRNLNPSGRFLKKDKETGYWYDIGDDRAKEKTSQALREGAPAIKRKRERESSGGGDGGDRSRDGDDDGSPDSKAARSSNTVSPGGSTTARGMSHEEDEHGSKGGDSGDDGETGDGGGKKHHRRRSVVEIEEVHIDEDEDDHSVEYEVTEEQVRQLQPGGNVLVSPGDGREAGAEGSDRSTGSNAVAAAAAAKVEEGRDEGPSSSSTDHSDREQDSTAGDEGDEDAASCQPGTADGTTKKRVRTSRRRPIVIRPALALTKQKLAEIKIEELSPQERATYAANFIPPRPNLQRGPRDGRRRVIRVSGEGLADI